MMIWQSLQQYYVAVTGSALTGLSIPEIQTIRDMSVQPAARVRAIGCNVNFKFGDDTVLASATVTASKLPVGNINIAEGAIEIFNITQSQNYISTISDDATSTGNLWVDIGYFIST